MVQLDQLLDSPNEQLNYRYNRSMETMVQTDNRSIGTMEYVTTTLHRKFSSMATVKNGTTDTFCETNQVQQLLQSYGQWVRDHMAYGWHGYLLTFMFSQIPGSDASRMLERKKYLGWFYGRLAKASVPKASSSKWSEFLPKVVLAPDVPVPKRSKIKLRDVTINDGLHWHGLMLVNPLAPKIQEPLDLHLRQNRRKYLVGSIREIDAQPITYTPAYLTGYGLKSLKKRFSIDEIVIFPRTVSELPVKGPDPRNGPVRAAGEKPTYDFQRA